MFEAYLFLDPARSLVSTGACYTSGSCKYLLAGWQLLRRVRTLVLNFAWPSDFDLDGHTATQKPGWFYFWFSCHKDPKMKGASSLYIVGSFLPSATCNHTSNLRPATFGSEVWSWSKGYWKQRHEKWSKNVWSILRNSRRIHSTWDIFGWLSSSFFANSCVLAAVSFLCLMDFNTKIILPVIWVTCFASFCLPPDISCELLDPFQIDWVGNALPRICTKVDTAVSLASSAQLRPFPYCQILTRVCNCIAWLFIAVGNHQFLPSSKFLILPHCCWLKSYTW